MMEWLLRLIRQSVEPVSTQPPVNPHAATPAGHWLQVAGEGLGQGDYLRECLVPSFGPDFAPDKQHEVLVGKIDLIIVTQSCDLENKKVPFVALCPIYSLSDFEKANAQF